MTRVLIVEDDREIRTLLREFLSDKGYEITEASDGNIASGFIHNENFDIILMDMMLPFKSGDTLIQELRAIKDDQEKSQTPVIVLSAKSRTDTRIEVLRMGADDYIIKPFDLDEVLVRIEVVLRRSEGQKEDTSSSSIEYAGVVIDKENNNVTYNGEPISLTAKEMQLLTLFMANPEKTFSKANLYETVWGDTYYSEDNTINVHMSNLRSKLKKATGGEFIETVWGIGYKLKKV